MTTATRLPLAGTGVRAVVAGNGHHIDGSMLPDIPEVADTVRAMGRVLTDRCGLASAALRLVTDPRRPEDLLDAIVAAADEADDVLLVYYVGHGVLSPSGQLHLATQATRDLTAGMAAYQALPQEELHNALLNSRARTAAVLLDCCFSGRATLPPRPGFLLTSASGMETALIPPDAPHPAFTGALLELLAEGDPDGPPQLTLDHAHRVLARRLSAGGRPVPRMQERDRAGELVLASNAAYRPPSTTPVLPEPEAPGSAEQVCPYPGLAAFTTEDARFFHGRDRAVDDLVRTVAARAWQGGVTAVIGPSGSGKSSLLRAGLIPAVRRGELGVPGSSGWTPVVLTPGPDPMGALTAALANSPHLIVIDQFEELFTQGADARARTDFVAALDAAARADGDRPPTTVVVLGLRGDFYGECLDDPRLRRLLAERQVLLGAMTTGQLRAAIVEPARATGHELMPGLAELLLHDLGCDPNDPDAVAPDAGLLPLLSHALREVWRRRAGRLLTVEGYQATGGITSALARTADEVYGELPDVGQDAIRRTLPRLVAVAEDRPDTPRRVRLTDLLAGVPDPAAAQHALHRLAAARLVTVDDPGAAITHEALMRYWPRLREWLDADRAWLRATQRLHADALAWDRAGREPSRLPRGAALAAATHEVELPRRRSDLPPLAAEFLDAATAQQRRGVRIRRTVVGALAAITVLALVASALAVLAQRSAAARRDELAARVLATEAATFRRTDPGLARQLTAAAFQLARSAAVDEAVLAAATLPKVATSPGYQPRMRVAYAPSGDLVMVGRADGVDLRAATDFRTVGEIREARNTSGEPIPVGAVPDLAVADGGRHLVLAAQLGLWIWDISDPAAPKALAFRPAVKPGEGVDAGEKRSVAVQPGGTLIAYWGEDEPLLLSATNPRSPQVVGRLPELGTEAARLAFSPDGRLLAAHHDDTGTVVLFDVSDPARPRRLATLPDAAHNQLSSGDMPAVAFGASGLLAFAGRANEVRLWRVPRPASPTFVGTVPGESGLIQALAFSPDGNTLVSGATGGTVRVSDVASRGPADELGILDDHAKGITGVAIAPDGGAMVTASWDGTARQWPFVDPRLRGAAASMATRSAEVLVADADHTTLVAVTTTGFTVWDTSDPLHPVRRGGADLGNTASRGETQAALSADGTTLAISVIFGQPVQLFDLTDPAQPRPAGQVPGFGSVAVSGDGRLLAIGNTVGQLSIFDINDPAKPIELATVNRYGPGDTEVMGWISALAFDPARPLLAVTALPYRTLVWNLTDVRTPRLLMVREDHEEQVWGLRVSPDGRWLASADRGGTVLIWAIADAAEIHNGLRPSTTVQMPSSQPAIDFSPEGRRLVAATDDGSLQVWDLDQGGLEHAFAVPAKAPPNTVLFGADGDTVSVGFDDAPAATYVRDPARMAALLCEGIGEPVTEEQWLSYVPSYYEYDPPCTDG